MAQPLPQSLPVGSIYYNKYTDLEKCHTDKLKPTKDFNNVWGAATDALASFLKNESPSLKSKVAATFKGGSLGKGTAIRGRCDLDVVLFLNGYDNVEIFKQQLPVISKNLENDIRHWHGSGYKVTVKTNKVRVVQIEMDLLHDGKTTRLPVDIVPAFTRRALSDDDPQALYQEMEKVCADDRSYYSSSLAKQQKDFVSCQPSRVKDLIRLVKDWRKTHLRPNAEGQPKIPKAYALELVSIKIWEEQRCPNSFALDYMLKLVLKKLCKPRDINISWTEYYTEEYISRYSGLTHVRGKPFILDPADPFHNVGADFDWTEMAAMALATVNSPRLRRVEEEISDGDSIDILISEETEYGLFIPKMDRHKVQTYNGECCNTRKCVGLIGLCVLGVVICISLVYLLVLLA